MIELKKRPRRNRKCSAIRDLVRETSLSPSDFVLPIFVTQGNNRREPISSMPGYARLSPDLALREAKECWDLGIRGLALFPQIPEDEKDPIGSQSTNSEGLLQRTIRLLKSELPEMLVITDVALDPYSSDGHDGLLRDGRILNDESLEILGLMALSHAQAGADIVAPSDMMDGRVGHIRQVLDSYGHQDVGIISYAVKYASAFYGPFREALMSAPKSGDKKTYQMDPANIREAIREVQLDEDEGADIVMVKPALLYLDVIAQVKSSCSLPVAAYNVSGEYSMLKLAAERGFIQENPAVMEMLTAIKRAGADVIFTYFAKQAASLL